MKNILDECAKVAERAEIRSITFEVARETFDEGDPVPFGIDPTTYHMGALCIGAYEAYYDLIQEGIITHGDIILWVSEAIAAASHDGKHGIDGNVN